MNKDQWTVLGLIVFLIFLEGGRSKTVREFLVGTWQNFNTGLTSASQMKTPFTSTNASGICPPGTYLKVISGGKRVCQ